MAFDTQDTLKKIVDNWSNSFLRPHIPPKLLSNSRINGMGDTGAKLIYAKFMYGEQIGVFRYIPFNGSLGNVISDLNEESLWLYSFEHEKIPSGFESTKGTPGSIRTGRVEKCFVCKGHGYVTCKTCKGKIRWTEKETFSEKYVEKICSCGNGKQLCDECTGFGELETIISVTKNFKLNETKNSQYEGAIPQNKIKNVTGSPVFEYIVEYPIDKIQEMLMGGINANEYNILNNWVLESIHIAVENELGNTTINTQQIHRQIDSLFNSVPNPGKENKLLEKEVIPIRVMVRVEDAPVTQIDYTYKEKNFKVWVYGNENKIWYKTAPFSFNYKIITILTCILFVAGTLAFNYFKNNSKDATLLENNIQTNTAMNPNAETEPLKPIADSSLANNNSQSHVLSTETTPLKQETQTSYKLNGAIGEAYNYFTFNKDVSGKLTGYAGQTQNSKKLSLNGSIAGEKFNIIAYTNGNIFFTLTGVINEGNFIGTYSYSGGESGSFELTPF